MKNNKKTIIPLISTFLILITIALISIPTSHSKYVKFDDYAAIYDTEFYDLYKDVEEVGAVLELLESSTVETAYFRVYFPTNTSVAAGADIDKYFLELVPDTCTIENWSSVTYRPKVDYVNKEPWVVSELLSCRIKPVVDETTGEVIKNGLLQEDGTTIKLVVNVKEQVDNEAKFLYLSLKYEDSLYNYNEKFKGDKTIIEIEKKDEEGNDKNNAAIYEELRKKLMEYAATKQQEFRFRVEYYIDNYIFNNVVTPSNVTSFYLPGISIVLDEEKDMYVYKINPSVFDDYAATFNEINYDHHNVLSFKFINDYPEGSINYPFVDETFEYYINNFSTYSTEEKSFIIDYVKNNGPLSKVVSGEIDRIKGINYSDFKAVLTANLIQYASPAPADNKFTVTLNSTGYMQNCLEDYLNKYNNIFSKTLIDYIYDDYSKDNLYDVIKINNTASKEIVDFTKYVIYYDSENNNYVIFKVYYNEAENGNTVEFITYKITDDAKISFVNNDDTLDITISNADQTKIEDVIKYLDEYFGSVTDITDPLDEEAIKVTFNTDSETGIITATYSIKKL